MGGWRHRIVWSATAFAVGTGVACVPDPLPGGGTTTTTATTTSTTTTTVVEPPSPGTYERMLGAGGVEPNDSILGAVPSDDGRVVAFETPASNVVADDTNDANDVFVWDRDSGEIDRAGANLAAGAYTPDISGDGTTVVFQSPDDAVVDGDSGGWPDVFAWDVESGVIERQPLGTQFVGIDELGEEIWEPAQPNNYSWVLDVSDDGDLVLIASFATNLLRTGPAAAYLWDRDTDTYSPITLPDGVVMQTAVMTGDGTAIAFEGSVPGVGTDTYVWSDGAVEMMDPSPASHSSATVHGISDDGRYVAIESASVLGDASAGGVYVWDRETDVVEPQPAALDGSPAGSTLLNGLGGSSISDDGDIVGVYQPGINVLVEGASLPSYVWRRSTASYLAQPDVGSGCGSVFPFSVSGAGRSMTLLVGCPGFVSGKTTASIDLVVWDRP